MNRADWLEERKTYLGGTDVAAIVGRHKYATPLTVWMSKTGRELPDESSRPAQVGTVMEPLILSWFTEETGLPVEPGRRFVHPVYPFLGGNVDGLVGEDSVLDAKTHGFGTADEWGEEGTDEIPDAYIVQGIWYCGITGRDRCYFATVDRGTLKMRYYMVEADTEHYELLVQRAVRFWTDHVLADAPPEAESAAIDMGALRVLYPTDDGEVVIATSDDDARAERLIELKGLITDLNRECDDLKMRLIERIGSASGIETAIGRITYKESKPSLSTDWKAIAMGLGPSQDLIEAHTAAKPGSRRFLLPRQTS